MMSKVYDTTAAELKQHHAERIPYGLPFLQPEGFFYRPALYEVVGPAQTYKTALAAEFIAPLLDRPEKVVWIDTELKFPRYLRAANLAVKQCRFPEDLLLTLIYLTEKAKTKPPAVVVIDTINYFYWFDAGFPQDTRIYSLTRKLSMYTTVLFTVQSFKHEMQPMIAGSTRLCLSTAYDTVSVTHQNGVHTIQLAEGRTGLEFIEQN